MSDNKQPILNVETELPPMIHNEAPPTAGSAAPSDDVVMPAIVTTGPNLPAQAGKKFAGGKFIATILGLFLLIGGVGAGTYLVQQNQDIREKAGIYTCGEGSGDGCEGKSNGDSCGGEKVCKIRENGKDCSCVGPNPPATPEPTVTPTAVPTRPPITPSARCQNIKAYSSTWTLLTNAQLSALKPKDKVNFCVTGTASVGVFDKAKFTINGVVQPETTSTMPGTTDFCQAYAIPEPMGGAPYVTEFTITAQIHHTTLGWK